MDNIEIKNSLKGKMILYFFIIIFLPIFLIGLYFYGVTTDYLKKEAKDELNRVLNSNVEKVDMEIDNLKRYLNFTRELDTVKIYSKGLYEEVVEEEIYGKTFKEISNLKNELNDYLEDISIVDRYGKIVLTTNSDILGKDFSKEEFFKESIKQKEFIGDIHNVNGKNKMIISTDISNYKNQVSGTLVFHIDFDNIIKKMPNLKFGETGYLFIINKEGHLLYHRNNTTNQEVNLLDYRNLNIDKIVDDIKENKQGVRQYTIENQNKLSFYRTFKNIGIVVSINEDEYQNKNLDIKTKIFYICLIAIIIAFLIAFVVARNFIKPIKEFIKLMKEVEMGNISGRIEIKSNDELELLADSFNRMLNGQSILVKSVIASAKKVNDSALESSSISQEMASSSETQNAALDDLKDVMDEMTKSVGDVADSVSLTAESLMDVNSSMERMGSSGDTVSNHVKEVSSSMQDLIGSMQEINSSIELIAQNSSNASLKGKDTFKIAQNGKFAVDNTVKEMDKINEYIKELSRVIEGLGNFALEIGNIVEVIDDISEQTNLLALNASIEAARAGDEGRGFAVVAEAISDLAEKSSHATKDIAGLIKQIQKELGDVKDKSEEGARQVERGVKLVANTGIALDKIFKSVEETTNLVDEIAYSTEQQSNASRFIMKLVEKLNAIILVVSGSVEVQSEIVSNAITEVEKVTALSQEIAGTTQEQFASSQEILNTIEEIGKVSLDVSSAGEEVAKNAQELASEADDLLNKVSIFKVD
ncbi:methyl-accepting chemotaxis protein [Peptostreptococcaceae bacterium AGR-M142]